MIFLPLVYDVSMWLKLGSLNRCFWLKLKSFLEWDACGNAKARRKKLV